MIWSPAFTDVNKKLNEYKLLTFVGFKRISYNNRVFNLIVLLRTFFYWFIIIIITVDFKTCTLQTVFVHSGAKIFRRQFYPSLAGPILCAYSFIAHIIISNNVHLNAKWIPFTSGQLYSIKCWIKFLYKIVVLFYYNVLLC